VEAAAVALLDQIALIVVVALMEVVLQAVHPGSMPFIWSVQLLSFDDLEEEDFGKQQNNLTLVMGVFHLEVLASREHPLLRKSGLSRLAPRLLHETATATHRLRIADATVRT